MASPCGITDHVPKLQIEAVQTVTPMTVTDQGRARKVSAVDSIVSGILGKRLHVVLYYKNVTEKDSGWFFAGWTRESLARALSEQQPMLAGRLRRGEDGDGEFEIVSNDSGVRLIEARIAITLSSLLELKGKEKEKEEAEGQLVSWMDIDEQNPQFSPLFYIQVTNFQCGGYSIGISCSLLLADLLVVENFLSSWANIHSDIVSNIDGSKKPSFYLPNLKTCCSSPTSIISSSPRKHCGQTMHFKVTTAENASMGRDMCKSLALLCIEESESRLATRMASDFYLFVKENSEFIKVEKCSNHGHVKPELSLATQVTCADWDHLGANEVAFRDGNAPLHVSYWMGSSTCDGVIMASSSPNEPTLGINILVTIPNASEL